MKLVLSVWIMAVFMVEGTQYVSRSVSEYEIKKRDAMFEEIGREWEAKHAVVSQPDTANDAEPTLENFTSQNASLGFAL